MKTADFIRLKKGDKVMHKRYGLMTVTDYMPDFGPMLTADGKAGCELLSNDSGAPYGTPFLEDSPKQINPPLPMKEQTTAPYSKEAVLILKRQLKQGISRCKQDKKMDFCSFGYETGVLITGNDAIHLLSTVNSHSELVACLKELVSFAPDTKDFPETDFEKGLIVAIRKAEALLSSLNH